MAHTPLLEGDLQKVSKETSRRSGDILRGFLHNTRAIPSMSKYVMSGLLQIARE